MASCKIPSTSPHLSNTSHWHGTYSVELTPLAPSPTKRIRSVTQLAATCLRCPQTLASRPTRLASCRHHYDSWEGFPLFEFLLHILCIEQGGSLRLFHCFFIIKQTSVNCRVA